MSVVRVNQIQDTSTNVAANISGGVVTFTNPPSGLNLPIELIHSVTLTSGSSSELDFNGHFSSTYTNYELHGTNIHVSSDGAHIGVRVLISNGVKSDSHYRYSRIRNYSGDATVRGFAELTDTEFAFFAGRGVGNDTGEHSNFKMTIYDPLSTDNYKVLESQTSQIDAGLDSFLIIQSGYYKNGTAALSGVRLFTNAGNIVSGKFKLYGIR
jgi:hypothetical protein